MTKSEAKQVIDLHKDEVVMDDGRIFISKDFVMSIIDMIEEPVKTIDTDYPGNVLTQPDRYPFGWPKIFCGNGPTDTYGNPVPYYTSGHGSSVDVSPKRTDYIDDFKSHEN